MSRKLKGLTMKKIILLLVLPLSTLFAISANDFITNEKCDQIINKDFLTICYDYNLKAAIAVKYTLQGDLVNEVNIEKRPYFKTEKSIPKAYRAIYSDYTHSGFDRGHIAPDAAFDWSQESLDATYSLANIMPQARKVNRYTWTKAERYARYVSVQRGSVNVVNVIKYPSFPVRIGDNGIAVPSGYYKVLYSTDQTYIKCLYYANDNNISTEDDRLRNHEVSCEELLPSKVTNYSFLIPILHIIND